MRCGNRFAVMAVVASLGFGAFAHAQPGGWQLVWSDEFDSPVVDLTRWNIRNAPGMNDDLLVEIIDGSKVSQSERAGTQCFCLWKR